MFLGTDIADSRSSFLRTYFVDIRFPNGVTLEDGRQFKDTFICSKKIVVAKMTEVFLLILIDLPTYYLYYYESHDHALN